MSAPSEGRPDTRSNGEATTSDPTADAPGLWGRLGAIGNRNTDTEAQKLRHRLLVFMGVMMSAGGVVWGSLAASQGLLLPAVIPYGYGALTGINLLYFHLSKDFPRVRLFQVFLSLLLPFLFQWTLGGFAPSGSVMLWAMLAIVGSLTFSEARQSAQWLTLYVILTLLSGFLDPVVAVFSPNPSDGMRTLFFVLNVTCISTLVFGLMIYLLVEREKMADALQSANHRVTELNTHLEDAVATRTTELRTLLARSQAIIDNMADGLVALDHRGLVQVANPALSRILFLDRDIVGKPARDVVPFDLSNLAMRSMDSRVVEEVEVALSGGRTGAAIASPISSGDERGFDVGSVVILRDVTLEKEIDRMKTDLVATVSHELRTPLTSVLGFAMLTKRKLEQSFSGASPPDAKTSQRVLAQVCANLDVIVSEGQRLTTLINDVLDISKMEAGQVEWKMEALAPRALVDRAIEATRGLFLGRDVVLRADVCEALPEIEGDFDRLLQVLINLISNAAKFTDAGSVTLRARLADGKLELAVVDTGRGIERADQGAVFEKFKQVGDTLTAKPKGTGLGLPICRQIVLAHRGTIDVESALGRGSTFRVTLPATQHP